MSTRRGFLRTVAAAAGAAALSPVDAVMAAPIPPAPAPKSEWAEPDPEVALTLQKVALVVFVTEEMLDDSTHALVDRWIYQQLRASL